MNDRKNTRAVELGKYIAETHCTVREAAKRFDIGKSTVHKDVTERLSKLDDALFEKVRKILEHKCEAKKSKPN